MTCSPMSTIPGGMSCARFTQSVHPRSNPEHQGLIGSKTRERPRDLGAGRTRKHGIGAELVQDARGDPVSGEALLMDIFWSP